MTVQFIRFLIVGVANTIVGLLTIYAAKWLFAFDDVVANIIGYGTGLTVSFLLNKAWTFRHKGEILKSALRFLASFAVAYPINLGAVLFLGEHPNMRTLMGGILIISGVAAVVFFGQRGTAPKVAADMTGLIQNETYERRTSDNGADF